MGNRVSLLATITLVAIGLLVSAGGTAAAPQSVSLATCTASATRTAVVTPDGGDITLVGPTFLGTNLGAIEDLLHQGTTTTFTVNGAASSAGSFSAPAAVSDPRYGAVWATTWSATLPAPAVGAPERAALQIVLQHVMPQLLAPASDGNAGFAAGATFSRRCTLDGGQPVGSAGGVVTTADHAVSLTIPSGALSTSTAITIDPSTVTPPTSIGAGVGTAYDFGPTGTQFSAPVTLGLSYDPASVPAGSERALHLAGLSNGVWRLLPSVVNATSHTVSAQARHFSSYAIVKATCTGFVVGGVVTDGTAPVVGAQAQEITGSISAPTGSDLTDVNGEYALCVPDLTTLYLRYEPPTGSTYASQWYSGSTTFGGSTPITLAGADVRADVTLGPGTPITGLVTDRATGLPLANAFVTIHKVTSTGFCCSFGQTLVERTTTDATGRYHAALPAASYKLVSFTPSTMDYVNQWWQDAATPNGATTLLVPSAASAADVSFALVPGFRVRGQVTDSAGAAVANAFAAAQGTDVNGNPSFVAGGGTDATGAYSFVVPAGTFKVQFNPPQGSVLLGQWWNNKASFSAADPLAVSSTQPPPTGGVNAVLATGFVISGTLRDASTGLIISGGNVSASLPLLPGQCCKPQFVAGTGVNPDGTFQFAVPAGTYIIRADPPQTSTYVPAWYGGTNDPSTATQLTLNSSSPGAATGLTIQLQPGFVISGTVRDAATGVAIANANVNANLVPAPGSCCQGVGGTNTQSDGSFRFVVPANTYILHVGAPQGSSYVSAWYGSNDPSTATQVALNSSSPGAGAGLALTLQLGFRISGHVTTPAGAPAPQIGVHAPDATVENGCGGGCGQTNANGDFDFAILPGTWKIRFDPQQSNQNLGTTFVVQYWNGSATFAGATPITAVAGGSMTGMNVTLVNGFLIAGWLRDAAGVGIANGNVGISTPPPAGGCCPQWVTGTPPTATDGSFRAVVPAGTYILNGNGPQGSRYIQAWLGGTDPQTATPITVNGTQPNAGSGLVIVLQSGFFISGQVVLNGTTTPAGGVQVGAAIAPTQGFGCCSGNVGTQTHADGTFSFVVAPNTYVLQVGGGRSSYVFRWYDGAAGTQDVMAAMRISVTNSDVTGLAVPVVLGYRISGHVSQPSGAPGYATELATPDLTGSGCGGSCAQTDANGDFDFAIAPGTWIFRLDPHTLNSLAGTVYALTYWNGNYTPVGATTINAVAGGAQTINATLLNGYRISGRVVMAGTTTGAGGVQIGLSTPSTGPNSWPMGVGGTQSAADGSFTIPASPGSYVLSVGGGPSNYVFRWYDGTTTGTRDGNAATVITVTNADLTGLGLNVILGYRISGHVSDSTGAPVQTDINVFDTTGFCNGDGGGTDASGNFDFAITPGSWKLLFNPDRSNRTRGTVLVQQYWSGSATWAGATPITATAGAGQTGLNASLATGLRIQGHVVSATSGVGIANVGLAANATQPNGCGDWAANTSTDGTGAFTLVVPNGTYRLFANAFNSGFVNSWYGGIDYSTATPISVPPEQLALTISLQPGLVITGRVIDAATLAPLAGAQVGATTTNNGCCWGGGAQTDTNGNYTLVVPAGSYFITFSYNNITTAYVAQLYNGATTWGAATAVTGAAGVTVPNINGALASGVVITGTVTGTAGAPVANVWVGANDGGPSAVCCQPALYTARTAGDGTYRLAVPTGSGPFRISFNPEPPSGYVRAVYSTTNPGTQDFYLGTDVPAGSTGISVTLAAGLHIRGTVTSAGVGVGGIGVGAVHSISGRFQWSSGTQTQADGSYDLLVVAGTYRLQFSSPSGSHLVGTWYGSVDDGNTATDVVVGPADANGINVSLAPGVWISGQVFRPDGVTPMVNISVDAQTNVSCCKWSPWQATTDATGTFHIAVPAGATYRMKANPQQEVTLLLWQWYSTTNPGTRDFSQGADLAVGTTDLTLGTSIRLQQGYAIQGHVTVGGIASPSANVNVQDAMLACCVWINGTSTQADGSYFVLVPAGSYKVEFDSAGHPQAWYGGTDVTTATTVPAPPSQSGINGAIP